jgi:hypothetical protein
VELPTYDIAVNLASQCTILNQTSMRYEPFVLNEEQRRLLKQDLEADRSAAVKPRQIGASTERVWLMTLIAMMNAGLPQLIIADEQKNAEKLLTKANHWLSSPLGAGGLAGAWLKDGAVGSFPSCDGNVRTLTLSNGAFIEAKTAISRSSATKESRAGRSSSYGVVYATEMAFWENAGAVWAAVTSTSPHRLLLDSTGAPGEGLFRDIVEGRDVEDGEWATSFFCVEDHASYRADPAGITDETWTRLQADYHFTNRSAAAWWWRKLWKDFRGDVFRMLREFPVLPAHPFMFAQGQHIKVWVECAVRVVDAYWNVYGTENDEDEPVALGVDTATGVGGDASALAVVGQRTGRTKRTYKRNDITIPDFIGVVRDAIDEWHPVATVIESNGVGAGVWSEIRRYPGANAVEHWSSGRANRNDSELHLRRAELKGEIETGVVPVGGDLLHEVKNSVVTPRATFEGPDDLLSALSIVRKWIQKHPAPIISPAIDPRVTYVAPTNRRSRFRV